MTVTEFYSTLRAKLGIELVSPDSQSSALPAEASAIKLHRSVLKERQCPVPGEEPKSGLRKIKAQTPMQGV